MKNIFLLLSSLFAVVPGITILTTNLGIPDESLKMIFIGVVEATGCLSLLFILLNRSAVKRFTIKRLNRIVVTCFCVFVASLVIYLFLYDLAVVNHPLYDKIYFPLWGGSDLENKIDQAGGRYQFVEKYYRDGARILISRNSSTFLTATTVIFLIIYQLIFTSLVYAFGLAAIRVERKEANKPS